MNDRADAAWDDTVASVKETSRSANRLQNAGYAYHRRGHCRHHDPSQLNRWNCDAVMASWAVVQHVGQKSKCHWGLTTPGAQSGTPGAVQIVTLQHDETRAIWRRCGRAAGRGHDRDESTDSPGTGCCIADHDRHMSEVHNRLNSALVHGTKPWGGSRVVVNIGRMRAGVGRGCPAFETWST